MKFGTPFVFSLSSVAAFWIAWPGAAGAFFARRMNGAACMVDFVQSYTTDYDPSGSAGSVNNDSTGVGARARSLFCPIEGDVNYGIPRTSINGVAVDGFDANNSSTSGAVLAHACIVSDTSAPNAVCAPDTTISTGSHTGAFSTFVGSDSITVLQATLNNESDWYGQLIVTLPPENGAGASGISGFHVSQ